MKITGIPTGAELENSRPVLRAVSAEPSAAPSEPPPVPRVQGASPEGGGTVGTNGSMGKVMDRIAEEVQKFIRENSVKLDMSFDEDLKMIVTKVMNEETGEVIRQYPPEEMVNAMKQLRGVLVNRQG